MMTLSAAQRLVDRMQKRRLPIFFKNMSVFSIFLSRLKKTFKMMLILIHNFTIFRENQANKNNIFLV